MLDTQNLAPGMTVRITRYYPDGKIRFIKTGTVGTPITPDNFSFTEDINSTHPGMHRQVSADQDLAAHMRGWTQHTEILTP